MAKKMTGKELVAFCRSKIGTAYVYGMKGKVMTEANFQYLYNTYGSSKVPYSDHAKVGKVCVDCSGLISWACGVVLGSKQWMNRANVKKPIASLKQAPIGALVWMDGHIGVYSGMKNGVHHYIAADGSKYGVREVPISQNRFTHWLLVESVFNYEMEEEEMVEAKKIYVEGKTVNMNCILKDDVNFVKLREIAAALGYDVAVKNGNIYLTKMAA
ncbi:MAG: hypothetical protein ACI4AO_00490 [Anaerotignum sp.]